MSANVSTNSCSYLKTLQVIAELRLFASKSKASVPRLLNVGYFHV